MSDLTRTMVKASLYVWIMWKSSKSHPIHYHYHYYVAEPECWEDVANLKSGPFYDLVCWGLTSLLNIWGHIVTVPACSSGTNVLPHRNAMPQTQDMTPHPVTVYRHGADLLCYPWMWNVALEYTPTHFKCLGSDLIGKFFPDLPHISEHTTLWWW